jgi:hypothetical protein
MWEYYLQSCEAGFRWSGLTVFQLQLAKDIEALPITRDYMVREEDRLRALGQRTPETPETPPWTPPRPGQEDGEIGTTHAH